MIDTELAIVARDVFCLYAVPDGMVAALRGLSLEIQAGERLLVHGPNGSGKTTLLRVLMGMQPASAGQVLVAGVELAGAPERTRATLRSQHLGVVDQHSARVLRPELSVLENVALHLRLSGVRKGEALRRSRGLLDELDLSGLADRAPATLSGGEAQRVAVCAAVAHQPSVVLADEPTGELDLEAADSVYELLASAVSSVGATLVLVTHDARAARIADRVVRIRDGRLSEQWSADQPQDETLVVDDRGWVRLPEPLRRAAGAHRAVRAALADGRITLDGADSPVPVDDASGLARRDRAAAGELVARLAGVRVAYAGRTVLDGVDLEVPGAAVTVIRGRSGAGKSTLLRVLLGLADPDGGSVVLGGHCVDSLGRDHRADLRRDHVAVSSQTTALVEALSVSENCALARAGRGLPADPVLVGKVMDSLALSALADRPVRMLSGGERQRVALARCLVAERPMIVLDEPTSHQDEAHAELVATSLSAAAARGVAVVCATHDPVLVADADQVLDLS